MRMTKWVRGWACAGLCLALPTMAASAGADDKDGRAPEQSAVESKPEPKQAETKTFRKGNRIDHARIRIELTPLHGFHSGKHPRPSDFALRTSIDYEFPIVEHLTISPRLIPIMYYNQGDGGDDVWAAGFGVVFRGYSNGREQRGWFGEVGLHVLGQSAKFEGNSGYLNFMGEAGFGYQFEKGWHVAGKVGHISNAEIFEQNAGVNNFGVGFGYSFKRH